MRTDVMLRQQKAPLSNSLPQAGERTNAKGNLQIPGLYAELMAHAAGLPNDELFAQMISSQIDGIGALPPGLGLDEKDFHTLLTQHFPGEVLVIRCAKNIADPRALERDDVLGLLLAHRAHRNMSEEWMAEIVTAACMASDHLWQDLGLWSRDHLSRLMNQNFPSLAAKNVHDMKWKKFIYKQLCEQEGINACRSPSCEYCADYLNCFGPEE
ncbi:nitrogen fixation protein NifQ [Sideroxydans sp. CL21]|uniref:nitrogen fixation protein NifQ n=1 Tax=Sideroxydans sp. CL21 TaxID=2600596 RepID=UPI0024BD0CD7|nr:nitrogen fixation protein NifQ [Sideroxydans sp. CL21]